MGRHHSQHNDSHHYDIRNNNTQYKNKKTRHSVYRCKKFYNVGPRVFVAFSDKRARTYDTVVSITTVKRFIVQALMVRN